MAVSTGAISIGYLGAVQFIPVALAVIIFFTFPILILILSPLIEGRGVALAAAGGRSGRVCRFACRAGAEPGQRRLARDRPCAARCWWGEPRSSFTGRALSSRMSPLHFGLLAHVAIVPAGRSLLIAAMGGDVSHPVLAPASITTTGYVALAVVALSYSGGYFCQMYALKSAPASAVAPYFNIEPVTSVVFAGLLLAEPPAWRENSPVARWSSQR
jgi:drug/metabolite transporter (DMT)-like permease